jgi:outer membrane protein OmpA-like peptidoglycan-associated protein
MLDTGTLRLKDVTFGSNSAELEPTSYPTLDRLGVLLEKWPELEIEIGGHTDSTGGAEHNRELSRQRAQSVLDYLLAHFPEINVSQYTVKGYGPDEPIAVNSTPEGRAKNRRVELKVLNRGVLEQEAED